MVEAILPPSPPKVMELYHVQLLLSADFDFAGADNVALTWAEDANSYSITEDLERGEGWVISWWFEALPDRTALEGRIVEAGAHDLTSLSVELVDPSTDWLSYVHQVFPAFDIGRFHIYGSHIDMPEIPEGAIGLQIDAATAFGSGEHETTKGCLLAMEKLYDDGFAPDRIADIGCGSGILAIAAHQLWGKDVVATDLDTESIRVCGAHAAANHCADAIITDEAAGYDSALIADKGPFDLVLCNILAGPLVKLAPDLHANLAEGGYAILSGLLVSQADEVIAAHTGLGLTLISQDHDGDWAVLVFQR